MLHYQVLVEKILINKITQNFNSSLTISFYQATPKFKTAKLHHNFENRNKQIDKVNFRKMRTSQYSYTRKYKD